MSRYQLNKAMYEATRPGRAVAAEDECAAFLARFALSGAERAALAGPDFHALLALGGLPNLVYRYYRAHGLPLAGFRDRLARERRGAIGMAALAIGLATSHLSAITRTPAAEDTPAIAALRAGFATLAAALHAARPDAAILISSDHLNRFFLDNMPAFCIGLLDSLRGPLERGTGVPDREVPGAPRLAAHLLAHGLAHGVDFARAEEWVVDHGFMVPLYLLDPAARIPVVPLHVNCAAPPCPGIARCYAVGRAIAAAISAWDADKRVAVIAAGGLSHSPGDARMGDIDTAFDRDFLARLASGSRRRITALSDARIAAAGSSTAEVRTWIALAGVFAGQPFRRVAYQAIDAWATGCGQCIVGEEGRLKVTPSSGRL